MQWTFGKLFGMSVCVFVHAYESKNCEPRPLGRTHANRIRPEMWQAHGSVDRSHCAAFKTRTTWETVGRHQIRNVSEKMEKPVIFVVKADERSCTHAHTQTGKKCMLSWSTDVDRKAGGVHIPLTYLIDRRHGITVVQKYSANWGFPCNINPSNLWPFAFRNWVTANSFNDGV